jgi:hypothetical protein
MDSPLGSGQESSIGEIHWLCREQGSLSAHRSPAASGLGKNLLSRWGTGMGMGRFSLDGGGSREPFSV